MKNYLAPQTPENRFAITLQKAKQYKVVKLEAEKVVEILGDYTTKQSAINRCPTGFVVITKNKLRKLLA